MEKPGEVITADEKKGGVTERPNPTADKITNTACTISEVSYPMNNHPSGRYLPRITDMNM